MKKFIEVVRNFLIKFGDLVKLYIIIYDINKATVH